MEKIIALAKRRGFLFPGSELYGGLANTWDFGHYGVLLKNNLRDSWWQRFVLSREDMVGLDSSIFLSPKVWQASGHVQGFNDALVDCKHCHLRTRADHLIETMIKGIKVEGLPVEKMTEIIHKHRLSCPNFGSSELTDVRKFNLLFETHIGIVEEDKSTAYLRGELAQGIFINFKNVLTTNRMRIPFGIASQGKAFRNEITLGQSVFRTLEFDLMEFEYFIDPENWQKFFNYWQEQMWQYARDLGLNEKKLRFREHEPHERSFYSKKTIDLEYRFDFGWKELWGLAYRTDYDLRNHMEKSGKDLHYTDQKTGKKYIPHVIEPSFGLSRMSLAILSDSYQEQTVNGKSRVYLSFKPILAPVKAAIFPLQRDERLHQLAKKIFSKIKTEIYCEFDDSGNIGQMYRRQDEIGTPFCVTIDYESLENESVTVRERNSMKQERIKSHKLVDYLVKRIRN